MWLLAKKIIDSGIKSETLSPIQDGTIEIVGKQLAQSIAKLFGRALAIRVVDAGSCNGCEQEISAANNPFYNLERFGVHVVASPRHADLLLVTGPVTKNMATALKKTFDATPDPKRVVAVGDCAACGGVFKDSYAVNNSVSAIIPVDVIVHGCPPTPQQIIQGIFSAIQVK
jgi:Ni,Fe-hydrogenase III small subunit